MPTQQQYDALANAYSDLATLIPGVSYAPGEAPAVQHAANLARLQEIAARVADVQQAAGETNLATIAQRIENAQATIAALRAERDAAQAAAGLTAEQLDAIVALRQILAT